ncbi:MAG: exodeoxyribonuclease VII large subunit [Clostridia bacterium]|nr:exodeoxyribonuclease VII large subunit [Clostridia bacterium]
MATVSQINGYIKKILESNIILKDIWIKGEISNFKLHYSGHIYVTLKDEGGVLKAVMFKGAASKLSFMPEDGMKVLARGKISVYEQGGAYQLYISEMIPDGVGDLHVAFEQMKKKLEAEGLFDPKYKKPIPKFPQCVGVVTAATGAAVRDIINVITRRYPLAKILLYPALVQGENASESVSKGIELFNRLKNADVLIVGRGGGSIEDLWAFNEERTARAIFTSEIPIISAVGHETDFTIADFVADLRAPTPSAAAEIAVPSLTEILGEIATDRVRLNNTMLRLLENLKLKMNRLSIKSPEEKYNILRQRIDDMMRTSEAYIKKEMLEKKKNMLMAVSKLDALSPLKVLSRGFSVASFDDGKVIRSVDDFEKTGDFVLTLPDGKAECIANKTYKKELL